MPDEPAWIRGDAVRLTQVFDNLLSNAYNIHVVPGTITVRLELTSSTVSVTVTDSGAGLTHELPAQIFEPFQQANQDLHGATRPPTPATVPVPH